MITKHKVKIDGKPVTVRAGTTVLQAAKAAEIYIPTLCHLEKASDYGGCRLCMVDIKGFRGFTTACTTPVADNMEIKTKTAELQKLRRDILELLLSEHPYTCLVCKDKGHCTEYMHTTRKVSVTTGCNFCPANGTCELQDLVDYLELKEINFPIAYRNIPAENTNPFYKLDYSLCVLCGRCVRVCNEVRNSGVLSFVQRGHTAIVGVAFGESQMEAGCEYCGACVDVCPTGSITEKMGTWVGYPDRSAETSCVFCSIGCRMNVNVKGNRIINIGPKPGKRDNPLQLCVRGKFIPGDLAHHPDRLTQPMIKKDNKWVETGWNEAISYIANNLERYRGNQFGMIGSAQDSIEDNYILQKFTRKVMRSNNTDLLGSYRNKELIKKIFEHYKAFSPPNIEEITAADNILAIGSNTSVSHPIIEMKIRAAYQKGTNVIAANDTKNRTFRFSKTRIQYKNGQEHNLLLLVLTELIKNNSSKRAKEITQQLKEFDHAKAMKACGIKKKDLDSVVKALNSQKNNYLIVGDSILNSPHSENNLNCIFNIKELVRDPANCKLLFLLDEGNRFGATISGMHPDYLGGFASNKDEKNILKWSDKWHVKLSRVSGISAEQMLHYIADDGITALYVIGNIPEHENLAKLKFMVQHNMFLSETSEHANVVLPMPFFTEINGHITNIEGNLKALYKVIEPPEGVIEPLGVISKIAEIISEKGFDYKEPFEILSEMIEHIEVSIPDESEINIKPIPGKIHLNGKKTKEEERISLEPPAYHYQGNPLDSLIPDMKKILNEE